MRLTINSDTSLQAAIGAVLDYSPETGLLAWKVGRGRCAKGAIAGYDTGRGYVGVRVNGRCGYAHRVAFLLMTGRYPSNVDHINGKRDDNRWSNLREVSRSENGMNMAIPRTNKSGVIGVFWNTGKGKWTAKIKVQGQNFHLGHFSSAEDAAKARAEAEVRYGFHENHGRCSHG